MECENDDEYEAKEEEAEMCQPGTTTISTTIETSTEVISTESWIIGWSTTTTHTTNTATSTTPTTSTKGQIISKCLFGVFNFFQKTNANTSHTSKNEFIRSFFGRILGLTICF